MPVVHSFHGCYDSHEPGQRDRSPATLSRPPPWGQSGRTSRVGDPRGRMHSPESSAGDLSRARPCPPRIFCPTLCPLSALRRNREVKFRVDRDVLADAVAWAARSLPVRPSVPVLAGLLIETVDDGDGLQLSTFDYETSARATLPASIQDEGKALVSGRLLSDICRSLPNKPVDMSTDGSKVSLTCGSARFSLQTMPVEEYPTLPEMPQATGTVRSDVFANAVAQAVTAAGR